MNWVYMVKCENGSYYTGFSVNLTRRYQQHLRGTSKAKYIAAFKAQSLACCWEVLGTKGDCLKIEAHIKKMNHAFKDKIAGNPKLLEPIVQERYGIAVTSRDAAVIESAARSAKRQNK